MIESIHIYVSYFAIPKSEAFTEVSHCLFIIYSSLSASIPPLSVVGLSEEEAVEKATGDILVFTSGFNPMKNTISGYASIQSSNSYKCRHSSWPGFSTILHLITL